MSSRLQSSRPSPLRTVRKAFGESEYEAIEQLLRETMTDAIRASTKDVVKEAVREVQEETAAGAGSGGRRGRGIFLLLLGAAAGYLLASRWRSGIDTDTSVEEPQRHIGIEQDESDRETTGTAGDTTTAAGDTAGTTETGTGTTEDTTSEGI